MINPPKFPLLIVLILSACTSCSISKNSWSPSKKYSPEQLNKDYTVFQNILEESHPGLYWYTPKDSMDMFFEWGRNQLKDSLTEEKFEKVLTYVIARLNCGHTVVKSSKAASRYVDTTRRFIFPLALKFWKDTAVVTTNLFRRDSIFTRGTIIKSIEGKPIPDILDTLHRYISSDGYNTVHKDQVLSNFGGFGSYYVTVFGAKEKYLIQYVDSTGFQKSAYLQSYSPGRDSIQRFPRRPTQTRKERKESARQSTRSIAIDTTNHIAMMNLRSFAKGFRLISFYKKSFKHIKKLGINNLVIDVRSNGGGNVTNSTALTKYIANKRFRIADSLYALKRSSNYSGRIEKFFIYKLFLHFMTHKKRDGRYHFGYFERHWFKPKRRNHFNGNVYVLTGGNSFSATTLFAHVVKPQDNVFIVGEETGGAAYGNTAWLIPDAELPETKIRFRLPLFRLVIDDSLPKNGRGILPEVYAEPTVDAIKNGIDFKMMKAYDLIKSEIRN